MWKGTVKNEWKDPIPWTRNTECVQDIAIHKENPSCVFVREPEVSVKYNQMNTNLIK